MTNVPDGEPTPQIDVDSKLYLFEVPPTEAQYLESLAGLTWTTTICSEEFDRGVLDRMAVSIEGSVDGHYNVHATLEADNDLIPATVMRRIWGNWADYPDSDLSSVHYKDESETFMILDMPGGLRIANWYGEDGNIHLSTRFTYTHSELTHVPGNLDSGQVPVTSSVKDMLLAVQQITGSILDEYDSYPTEKVFRVGRPELSPAPAQVGSLATGQIATTSAELAELFALDETGDVSPERDMLGALNRLGGYADVKQKIRDFMDSLAVWADGDDDWGTEPPNGILLHGPKGVGKTTFIRAMAEDLGADLFIVDPTEIYKKFVGDSEEAMTALMKKIEAIDTPTVVFFNEIDGILRGEGAKTSVNAGVDQAVAIIFKKGIDRIRPLNPNVIWAADTNHYRQLDDTVIRGKRFDVHIEVPLPTQEDLAAIFNQMINDRALRTPKPIFGLLDPNVLGRHASKLCAADLEVIINGVLNSKKQQQKRTGIRPDPVSMRELTYAIASHKNSRLMEDEEQ